MSKLLSIAITTFNRPLSFYKCFLSIAEQIDPTVQLIVVDDCSNVSYDELPNLKSKYSFHYVKHQANLGLASARNTALGLSQGTFFTFLDDDDVWPPNRFIQVMEFIKHQKDFDIALTLHPKHKCVYSKNTTGNTRLSKLMLLGMCPPVGSQIYKTSLVKSVNGYNPSVTSGVDHDLWVSLVSFSNPIVSILWCQNIIRGKSIGSSRMTTLEYKRQIGISKSLALWNPALVQTFGEPFARFFKSQYINHLNSFFAIQDFNQRNFLSLFKRLILNPYLIYLLLNKYLRKKRYAIFLFEPYL